MRFAFSPFAGSRSEEVDPDGESKIRYQNAVGKPLWLIDEVNREIVNRYDGQNRVIFSTQPEGNTIAYRYDDATCGTDRCSHNVLSITETPKPGSSLAPLTQVFSYDPGFGKILPSTGVRGATTNYGYDDQTGELTSVTLPPDQDGNRPQRAFTYGSFSSTLGSNFSLLGSQTDKISTTESTVTTYSYDAANHFVPQTVTVDTGGLNLVTTSTYDRLRNYFGSAVYRQKPTDRKPHPWPCEVYLTNPIILAPQKVRLIFSQKLFL